MNKTGGALAVLAAATAISAEAAMVTFEFNRLAGSPDVVRPSVATLTMTDTMVQEGNKLVEGVSFLLTPHASAPGFADDAEDEFLEKLTLAFGGFTGLAFTHTAPWCINCEWATTMLDLRYDGQMGAGYVSQAPILLDYRWDQGGRRFNVTRFDNGGSMWLTYKTGLTVDTFTRELGYQEGSPWGVQAVLTVQGYGGPAYDSNTGIQNLTQWLSVAEVHTPVPEPGSLTLAAVALAGLGVTRRRKA